MAPSVSSGNVYSKFICNMPYLCFFIWVYRFPAVSTTGLASSRSIELCGMHGRGPLRPLFLSGQGAAAQPTDGGKSYYRLATVGKQDGLVSVWNVEI